MKKDKVIYRFIVLAFLGVMFLPASRTYAQTEVKPFTLVVLPDTQCYADTRVGFASRHWGKGDLRHYFFSEMQWIKENKDKLNIVMVAHAGDIVQTDHEKEWEIADKAFKTIDDAVPYIVCLGNHDFGYRQDPENPTKFKLGVHRGADNYNKFFGPARFEGKSWYGGHFGQGNKNYYCLFEAGDLKFLIISLEFNPRDEALTWANNVAARHPDRQCIVLTHSYLDGNNKRLAKDPYCAVPGNAGEAVWEKFVSRHENIFLVLCGHMEGEGLLTSVGQKGNKVHQVLSCYEFGNEGGEGYLRAMTFMPEQDKIEVQTYSPFLKQNMTTAKSRFSLEYPMKKTRPAAH